MWDVVEKDNYIPTKKDGAKIPRSSWNEKQKTRYLLNYKGRNFLMCALTKLEYEKVRDSKINMLVHKGTSQVKEYLQIAYQELLSNSSTISLGYKELKKFFSKLSKEEQTSNLSKVNISKVNELQKEVIDLRQSLAKFVNDTKNLNKLLKYIRRPHDKLGLGFEKDKELKEKPNIHCLNHRNFGCRFYDYIVHPKGSSKSSRTNPKGPKKI
ncbi:hypothetical protein CR513_26783, partial [Mucuna pruriens]